MRFHERVRGLILRAVATRGAEPARPAPAELRRDVVVITPRDRDRTYPASGLTPQRLAALLRDADRGDMAALLELCEDMEERWGHLSAVLRTRKLALCGLPIEVSPAVVGNARAEELAAFVRSALARVRGLRSSLMDLADAIGKGYAVVEPRWEAEAGKLYVRELVQRSQRKFRWTADGELRLLTEGSPTDGVPVPRERLIVHESRAQSGDRERAALLRSCVVPYLFAGYALKDWVAFAEAYGHPYIIGRYDSGASESEKAVIRQAVRALAADSRLVCSKAAEIDIKEAANKAAASDLYSGLVSAMEETVSKVVLGQTQTTQIAPDAGSRASSIVHAQVRQDILEADALALAETLTDQLVRPLVEWNFGPGAPVPVVCLRAEQPEDLEAAARRDKTLFVDMGLPVARRHLYAKYGVPEPEEGDELLEPPRGGDAQLAPARRAAEEYFDLSAGERVGKARGRAS